MLDVALANLIEKMFLCLNDEEQNEERIEIILISGSGICHKLVLDINGEPGKHIIHDR